jgi:hypothetical protein
MNQFSTFGLPSTYVDSTPTSRSFQPESSTFGRALVPIRHLDLQSDLSVPTAPELVPAESPMGDREAKLSAASSQLLMRGMQDVWAGRVTTVPTELLEADED